MRFKSKCYETINQEIKIEVLLDQSINYKDLEKNITKKYYFPNIRTTI